MNFTRYKNLLQSCIKTRSWDQGKLVHAHIITSFFQAGLFLQNNLLNMYCKSGNMDFAHHLFVRMPEPNTISWNILISGYSQIAAYDKAINVFSKARNASVELDHFSYSSALSVCSQTRKLKIGKELHTLVIVNGFSSQIFLINSLIDMYFKCGCMEQATILFYGSDEVDAISWNSLIAGYARIGKFKETFRVFILMHRRGIKMNSYVLGSILKACSCFDESLHIGKMVHCCIVKIGLDLNSIVGTAMLDMYAKLGELSSAIKIFNLTPNQNVVMFNAMIAGFIHPGVEPCNKFAIDALILFSKMQKRGVNPSNFTFSSIIRACISVQDLECGKQIHAHIVKNDVQSDEFIASALIDMYSDSSLIEEGLKCFKFIPKQDIVSWTSMIAGYIQNGLFEKAMVLFHESLTNELKPDQYTISSVLSACANLAASWSGQQIHSYGIKMGFDNFAMIENAKICMYAKSGDIVRAHQTFVEMMNRDVVSWSVMICSHAQHGCSSKALELFNNMIEYGVQPDEITFLGVLTACSHGGLVNEGFRYFECMKKDYNVTPNTKHYACFVDLLGRAGRLTEAENLIKSSGFDQDPTIWRALLGACRIHGDVDAGKKAAHRIIELEPKDSASYVLLYNIYLEAGEENMALNIRNLMKNSDIKKDPGLSWIEIRSEVHSFVVGDRSHPKTQLIYRKLRQMMDNIVVMGYSNNKMFSRGDLGAKKKDDLENHHSERLAVALGILSLPELAPIKVMKNLRVCGDCHTVMKFFSRAESREIILRDPIRFHHFRNGLCSCGDYW